MQGALESDDASADTPLDLVYYNAAFSNTEGLSARVTGLADAKSAFIEHGTLQVAFRKWLRGVEDESDDARRGRAYIFDGLVWTAVVIDTYLIVSGLHASLLWPDLLATGITISKHQKVCRSKVETQCYRLRQRYGIPQPHQRTHCSPRRTSSMVPTI